MKIRAIAERIAQVVMITLIAISVAELGFYIYLHRRASLYRADQAFPQPSGYLLNKQFMAGSAASCYLLRISSDDCPFCKLDQAQFEQLLQEARKTACQTVVIAPSAGQMKLDEKNGMFQLQYVDMKFGRTLNPFMTPETLLLDAKSRLVWHREGSMDDHSLALGLQALGKLR